MINLFQLFFVFGLILGILISISSSSWFGVWVGLELNLMSFVPLVTSVFNRLYSEAALKYFLIQAFGSVILLFSVLGYVFSSSLFFLIFLMGSLLLKLGAAPFHFWFPNVMGGLSWMGVILLMVMQKITPFVMLNYIYLCVGDYLLIFLVMSILVGSLGGLNQLLLRVLLAYSSIGHVGWMMGGILVSDVVWFLYFIIYSLCSLALILFFMWGDINCFSQLYGSLFFSYSYLLFIGLLLISLGGLPPFLGFYSKWMVIFGLLNLNYSLICLFMVMFSLIVLYWYLRLGYSLLLGGYDFKGWLLYGVGGSGMFYLLSFFVVLSLFGFMCVFLVGGWGLLL
uniref:NADH-ubiquinone oxidoreductase chain 2 n=1 Tax=Hutchinsoniella macracantha TaxID=84335 RepID=Q6SL05_9CRUS|nr:NADH dehydrogenase subunit 2 [Hutchinsoniella macracantha]